MNFYTWVFRSLVAGCTLLLANTAPANDGQAQAERFSCLIAGQWDNLARDDRNARFARQQQLIEKRTGLRHIPKDTGWPWGLRWNGTAA